MAEVFVEVRGLDGAIDALKALPPEIVSRRGGPVKKAVRKAGLVILREAKLNLAHATENLTGDYTTTGLLEKNLILQRGKPPPGENGERYLIRVKRRAYQRNGKTVTTIESGRFLEYGTEKQRAEPWLRPAGKSKSAQAIQVGADELNREINRISAKLIQQGQSK